LNIEKAKPRSTRPHQGDDQAKKEVRDFNKSVSIFMFVMLCVSIAIFFVALLVSSQDGINNLLFQMGLVFFVIAALGFSLREILKDGDEGHNYCLILCYIAWMIGLFISIFFFLHDGFADLSEMYVKRTGFFTVTNFFHDLGHIWNGVIFLVISSMLAVLSLLEWIRIKEISQKITR